MSSTVEFPDLDGLPATQVIGQRDEAFSIVREGEASELTIVGANLE